MEFELEECGLDRDEGYSIQLEHRELEHPNPRLHQPRLTSGDQQLGVWIPEEVIVADAGELGAELELAR